jgi:spermidine synthase
MLGGLLALQAWLPQRHTILMTRNFYGVLRVREYQGDTPSDRVRALEVGEIVHGIQFQYPARTRWATTYYDEQSGIGLALRCWPESTNRHIGIIGLGIGTLAAYGKPSDTIRFYEINPAVVQLAREQFSFLSNSQARTEVVLGDARLSLEAEPPQSFDILVLDAFTSDAIPVHLLTREAMQLYLRHLKSDGLLAVHTSNRHLDLRPVVENLARHFNMEHAVVVRRQPSRTSTVLESTWVLVSKRRDFFTQPVIQNATAPELRKPSQIPLWTDEYASLFPLLRDVAARKRDERRRR